MPKAITSKENPLAQQVAKLFRSSKERREAGRFALEGARLCEDAARSGMEIEQFLYTPRGKEKYPLQWEKVRQKAHECCELSEPVAQKIADTASPQGLFCVCRMPELRLDADAIAPEGKYLLLENLQDPANLGAVLRTAEACGLTGVLLAGACCDPFGPKALRAGMGALFRQPVFRCPSAAEAARLLQQKHLPVYAAVPAADAVPVTALSLKGGCAMMVGNEGNGLTPEATGACTGRVTIPMKGRAESLNAAAAAAILIWEMVRAGETCL